jgi:predicted nucleic acid-binding protein
MNEYFVDTAYWLALELANDQNHQTAVTHWQQLIVQLPLLVTTSYVFDEVVTYFNNRGHHQKAVQVGYSLLHSPSVELIQVDENLFHVGWDYLQQYQDKRYSLTDCISFVVMQQRGIQTAVTFDQHFTQAGFHRVPG